MGREAPTFFRRFVLLPVRTCTSLLPAAAVLRSPASPAGFSRACSSARPPGPSLEVAAPPPDITAPTNSLLLHAAARCRVGPLLRAAAKPPCRHSIWFSSSLSAMGDSQSSREREIERDGELWNTGALVAPAPRALNVLPITEVTVSACSSAPSQRVAAADRGHHTRSHLSWY